MDVDETDVAAAADDEADAMDAMEEDGRTDTSGPEPRRRRHPRRQRRLSARVDRGALMEVMSAVGGGRTNASISAVPWRVKLMQIEEEIFII